MPGIVLEDFKNALTGLVLFSFYTWLICHNNLYIDGTHTVLTSGLCVFYSPFLLAAISYCW